MTSMERNYRKTKFSSTEMRLLWHPEPPPDGTCCLCRVSFLQVSADTTWGGQPWSIAGVNDSNGLFQTLSLLCHQIVIYNSCIVQMMSSCHSSLKFPFIDKIISVDFQHKKPFLQFLSCLTKYIIRMKLFLGPTDRLNSSILT